MKKIIALLLAAIMVLGLAACASKTENTEASDVKNVVYIVNGNLGDKSFFDSAQAGIDELVKAGRITCKTIELGGTDGSFCMRERILEINPDCDVRVHQCFYLPETADQFNFSDYDYVVDAVDTVTAKVTLVLEAQKAGVPIISCMGAGNKLAPSCLRIADITKTSVCPLARAMRVSCKKKGIRHMTVAYSLEPMHPPVQPIAEESGRRKDIPGSTAFVPGAMGLLIASHVVRTLMAGDEPARPEG